MANAFNTYFTPRFNKTSITVDEVKNTIQQINNSYSTGDDLININTVKAAFNYISNQLAEIFNFFAAGYYHKF